MTLWLVGGLDPSGGAGLLRDHWTAVALGAGERTRCAVTAFSWQGQGGGARARAVDPAALAGHLKRLPRPTVIKLGLVPDSCAPVLVELLRGAEAAIVIDPVMRASDGGNLGATAAGLTPLIRIATLATPNLEEAQALCGDAGREPDLLTALARRFEGVSVLIKGGHGGGDHVEDRLAHAGAVKVLQRPRRPGPDVRGTGCALATAMACALLDGRSLTDAVGDGVAWLDDARKHVHRGPDGRMHLRASG